MNTWTCRRRAVSQPWAVAVCALPLFLLPACRHADSNTFTSGSKAFTENVTLGEILATQVRQSTGGAVTTAHRAELGGTRILWEALVQGEIDAYVEYSGTLEQEIFAGVPPDSLPGRLAALGVGRTAALGFNNTYVLGTTQEFAERTGARALSHLQSARFGLTNEFMDRADGWPMLVRHYGFDPAAARGLQHDLAYRALLAGDVDVVDLYSTDAEIQQYNLVTLQDDKEVFPRYDALILYRLDLPHEQKEALHALEGTIAESTMVAMNAAARVDGEPPARIAHDFVALLDGAAGRVLPMPRAESRLSRMGRHTADHLVLVAISLGLAMLAALPLGIWAAIRPGAGRIILGLVGVMYTIPALAMLVFMIPLLGIGTVPAIVALFLYSLLPIVRNTHAGIAGLDGPLRESAAALGLSTWFRLRHIDIPLAIPTILAGVKTAAVINIGTATLGALIGAGGLGQPIVTGIRLGDTALILEGAVPAALLAVAAQGAFGVVERLLTR
ncbi:MAG: amino acid ABC transporter permease [Bacteroidetes bacterium CG12_big_fil_rev_8_21_14_0_65_60_17]|nr:MAG: amino acid ABC transporter permease [Bacteroidetes bacterium CG12_big_fil_rev_8_21_14_0_65_60_17]